MKVNAAQISRALDDPNGVIKLYLLYGPDDAGSHALAARLDRAMGADSERIDLDGATLKDDPARLADEVASISLFGGRRYIRVSGGDECTPAVSALLQSSTMGDPVVLISGALKPTSSLLKIALADRAVLGCVSYKPEGSNADALAASLGRGFGLRLTESAARQLGSDCLNDRALMDRELEKIALYLDAAPDRPRNADTDALAAIGAGLGEVNTSSFINAVLSGKLAEIGTELQSLAEMNTGVIPMIRSLARRLSLLMKLRAEVDRGKSVGSVMEIASRSLFSKEKDAVANQLRRWDSLRLRTAMERLHAIEQAIKQSGSAGEVLALQELLAIGRVAERLR